MIATVSFCATALIFHARREHENLFGSSNKRKLVKRCWISVCASEFFVLFLELRQHFYLRAIFNACFVVQVIHVLPFVVYLYMYIARGWDKGCSSDTQNSKIAFTGYL
jgi:hypothetical protein